MKKLSLLVIAAIMLAIPANAGGINFGLKGGLNLTSMSLNSSALDKSNQAGFFIGPTVKVVLPIVGLGFDVSALYDQRQTEVDGDGSIEKITAKSINIPINLRYTYGFSSLLAVYAAVGPQFGFNVGYKGFSVGDMADFRMKDSDFSVNVGIGVTVLKHLEIGGTYNIACSKTSEVSFWDTTKDVVTKKNSRMNAWQISLAYYF